MNKTLTDFETNVILKKATERPGTGLYTHLAALGQYHCKACNAALYRSDDKFDSHCGWPSFDQEIAGAVTRVPDSDGHRIEIICANCKGHLGHVFEGENFTEKNTRHCVNSVSLKFYPTMKPELKTSIFASGCFWGTEYFLSRVPGVVQTIVGYTGGTMASPTYEAVCSGKTGHVECVQVTYDPSQVDFKSLAALFFETHDFSQEDGQGPDIGSQYLSVLYFKDDIEKATAMELVNQLKALGHHVATQIRPIETFWPGEEYHRNYYERQGKQPYCHRYRKIFAS